MKISFLFRKLMIQAVKNLNLSRSCGVSMIILVIIKNSINTLAPHLAFLFKTCIKTGEFRDDFKIAIVSPMFKDKGDSSHSENYRVSSVLTTIAKIFERLVSSQISKYFITVYIRYSAHLFFTENLHYTRKKKYTKNYTYATCNNAILHDITGRKIL